MVIKKKMKTKPKFKKGESVVDTSITIKNEPGQKLKSKVGKLEIDDYEDCSDLVHDKAHQYKQFSPAWSKWATLEEKLEKKIDSLHKQQEKALQPPKEKKVVMWWCMSCQKEHTNAKQIMSCPECGSTEIKKLDEYLADQARAVAA